ncbi:MAG: MATE family efflux transporter [Aquificaceae bacterium]|nr:MATE family efflux transporter [Aquificaceae bacterium]
MPDNRVLIDPSESRLKVAGRVFKLALPIILSNLLYSAESAFSLLLVSGLSATAVAAVGYSASMLWFIYSLMAIAYTGTSVLVAQRVGAGKDPSPALLWGMVLATLIALPLTFWGEDLVVYFMLAFGASTGVAELAREYLRPVFLVVTVSFLTEVLYAGYSGYGDTKTPFKVALLMNLVHISCAYLLIYGEFGFPRLEVSGAGWGVALSELTGFVLYCYLYLRHRKPFPVRPSFDRGVLLQMLRIGAPSAVERATTSLSFNVFVGLVAQFGDKALAAHQVGLRVESISYMVGFGMMIASTTLSGQNYGAKNFRGLDYGVKVCAHSTALAMGFIGLLLMVFPHHLSMVFTRDPEVINYAVYYLVIVALSQPQMAYASIFSGSLKGMGKTHLILVVNLSSFWLFRILPSLVVLELFSHPVVPWVFMSLETTLRALIFYWVYRREVRRYL